MRIANIQERAVIVTDDGAIDIHDASGGRFGPDPMAVYAEWAEFRSWADRTGGGAAASDAVPIDERRLGAPSPRPRQVFAIGLNYAAHAAESGIPEPEHPTTFTKFPTCITGPQATVELPSESVDWEVELVAIVGAEAHDVSAEAAWAHIAGLTVGQDLSDRPVQLRPPVPQFSLGKSFPGFGPTGPWLVTPDELDDPDDLALSCTIDGVVRQSSSTADLIFSVPALVAELSAIVPLLPGDVIFTGTPSGVGMAADPPEFLRAGNELISTIEGVGSITTRFTGPSSNH